MIWRSTLPAPGLGPDLIHDDLLGAADRFGARAAVIDGHTHAVLTFGELAGAARRLAAALAAAGVRRGDTVELVAGNGHRYPVALYGALAAGARVGGANRALTAAELARRFAITQPAVVFADAPARRALAGVAGAARILALEAPRLRGGAAAEEPEPGDVALLFASSGTTGPPKIAAHTHASTTAFLRAFAAAPCVRLTQSDVVGTVIPFAHLFGTAVLSHGLRNGATVVSCSAPRLDADAFLRLLCDHRVTVTFVTPPLLHALARHPLAGRLDLTALRLVITGAAPSAPELQDEVQERLGCRVADALGSTEAWCYAPPADPPLRGSVGTVGAGMQASVVDPDSGAPLGPLERGELWIRGPQVMAGYLGAESPIGADGWLRTGDLCTLDADGNVYLVDRLKDLIKVGGYSAAPAEIEAELTDHPAVADAAVVGRPDPRWGEVPVAFVALRRAVAPDELRAWLHGRLAPWKQIHDVIVVDQVPRNPAGKLLRRALQDIN